MSSSIRICDTCGALTWDRIECVSCRNPPEREEYEEMEMLI